MKRFVFLSIFLFLSLILCFSFFARAESIKPTGSVSVFGIYTDENDRLDNDKMSALGEYEEWWSGGEGNIKLDFDSLKFEGYVRDDYDWFANLGFDAKRMFQFKGSVNRMFHYFGHEIPFPEGYPDYTDQFKFYNSGKGWWSPPYDDVIANEYHGFKYYVGSDNGTGAGDKIVRFTDLNVGKNYYIRITRYATSGIFHVPTLPGLKLFYDFNRYEKFGHRQMYYMGSKCATCHIYTYGRRINERSNTLKLGLRVTRKLWGLEYYYEYKDFEDKAKPHSFNPDKVHHPANENANPFLGIVFYDENNLLYANTSPDVYKYTHVVKFYLKGLPLYSKLVASYVYSNIKSEYDDDAGYDLMSSGGNFDKERESLSPHFYAFLVSLTSRPLNNLTVNAKYRYYSIDADNVDVTLYPVDPSAAWPDPTCSPITGTCSCTGIQTHPYGDSAHYTYHSYYVLDRDVNEVKLALSYILKSKYVVSLGWEMENINRSSKQMNSQNPLDPNFPDSPYMESYDDTTTNSVFLNFNGKPFKKLSFRFSFRYDYTDDPFEFEKAKCPSDGDKCYIYDTWQYYRKLIGSADPENSYTTKLSLDFTPTKNLILGFNGRYSYQDNDDADWDKYILSLGTNLIFQLTEKLTFNLGYEYQNINTETPAVVPIFDG